MSKIKKFFKKTANTANKIAKKVLYGISDDSKAIVTPSNKKIDQPIIKEEPIKVDEVINNEKSIKINAEKVIDNEESIKINEKIKADEVIENEDTIKAEETLGTEINDTINVDDVKEIEEINSDSDTLKINLEVDDGKYKI